MFLLTYLLPVVIGGNFNLISSSNAIRIPRCIVKGEGYFIMRQSRPELLQLAKLKFSYKRTSRGEELARTGSFPRAKRSVVTGVMFKLEIIRLEKKRSRRDIQIRAR